MPLTFSVGQFCDHFNINRTTFYNWRNKGLVKPVKIGGRTLVPAEQVRALLAPQASEVRP